MPRKHGERTEHRGGLTRRHLNARALGSLSSQLSGRLQQAAASEPQADRTWAKTGLRISKREGTRRGARQLLSGRRFARRGVVESIPHACRWTAQERARLADFLKRRSFTEYVYAPKDDPYQTARWREPYPAKEMAALDDLLAHLSGGSLELVFGLSPGGDVTYSDPQDEAVVWRKWEPLWERGVRRFLLAFDDAPGTLGTADRRTFGEDSAALGRAQGEWLARLWAAGHARSPEFSLVLCPTEYCGVAATPYREALARSLPKQIAVAWTGPQPVSERIRVADAQLVGKLLGRPPLLWDNYPTNAHCPERLHLGPIRGREAGLAGVTAGVWASPMRQATASELALDTWSRFMSAPDTYDPQRAWKDAAHAIGGRLAGDALLSFARLCQASTIASEEAPQLAGAVDAFWQAWGMVWGGFEANHVPEAELPSGAASEFERAADELASTLSELAGLPAALESHLPPQGLVTDLRPWLTQLADEAAVARAALAVFMRAHWDRRTAVLHDLPVFMDPGLLEGVQRELRVLPTRPVVAGGRLRQFAARALHVVASAPV